VFLHIRLHPDDRNYWNPATDKLLLAAKFYILAHDHLVMKREVLKDLSKIFDLLGFVIPIHAKAIEE